RHVEVRMERRPPRALDAMDGPDPPVLLEMRRRRWMPVLRVHDVPARLSRPTDLLVDYRDDLLPAPHREAAGRVGEVVLDVGDDQRDGRPVGGHLDWSLCPNDDPVSSRPCCCTTMRGGPSSRSRSAPAWACTCAASRRTTRPTSATPSRTSIS